MEDIGNIATTLDLNRSALYFMFVVAEISTLDPVILASYPIMLALCCPVPITPKTILA